MIITRIHGGLGNQMFQYALGRNLSLIHNVPLKLDYSYLKVPNQSSRSFRLHGFQIKAEEATAEEIRAYRSDMQKILDRFRPYSKKKKVLEESGDFEERVLSRSDGYFDGHWQNEKYFRQNEETIRKDFALKNPPGEEALRVAERMGEAAESVSLHIRRGDYVSIKKIADVHGVLPMSYYKNACDLILQKIPSAHFFISSDDIGWAKEHFPKNYPVEFISSPNIPDYEELALMNQCRHHIIANSTMSWWAAYLNQNPAKIVIAPKNWFRDPTKKTENLVLKTWTRI